MALCDKRELILSQLLPISSVYVRATLAKPSLRNKIPARSLLHRAHVTRTLGAALAIHVLHAPRQNSLVPLPLAGGRKRGGGKIFGLVLRKSASGVKRTVTRRVWPVGTVKLVVPVYRDWRAIFELDGCSMFNHIFAAWSRHCSDAVWVKNNAQ